MIKSNIKYPIYKPYLNSKEEEYVMDCLKSGWISSLGQYITTFEKSFSSYLGVKYSISCSSGTTALHLAMLALELGKGDEVILPSLTFVATANAITYTGATPIFADSYKNTFQLNIEDVQRKITKKTKAVIAVHLYGNSCEIDKLKSLCKKNKLYLIEDNAEALGTKFKNQLTGSFGDISCFSFYGNKTITTGEGGMVCTNDKKLAEKINLLKDHGLDKKAKEYYTHSVIGYNYRMTNISAAIGQAQLESIEKIIQKKRFIASYYDKKLETIKNIQLQFIETYIYSTYWLYSFLCTSQAERNKLIKYLKNLGIDSRPFFVPLNNLDIYKNNKTNTPISSDLALRGINIPSYPSLSIEDLNFITNAINNFYK